MAPKNVHPLSFLKYGAGALTLIALGACSLLPAGPGEVPAGSTEHALPGTRWYLAALGPVEGPIPVLPNHLVTLEFGTDGTAGGNAGCNSYGGAYTLTDGTIAFQNIASTLMACEDPALMDQEARYLAALNAGGRLQVTEGTLQIASGDGHLLWFNAAPPLVFEDTAVPTAAASPSAEPFPTFISGLLCSASDETPAAGWAFCRSLEYGFSIQFPAEGTLTEHDETHLRLDLPFAPDANLIEKYLVIYAVQDLESCSIPVALGFEPGPAVSGEPVAISGVEFFYEEGGGLATGHIYEWLGYSAAQGDVCVSIGLVLHSFSPGVMETPPPVFDREAEIAILEPIVASFRWLNPSPEATPVPTPSPIPESSAERIQFPAGGITGAVSGELGPSGSALYVLYAFAGQTLTAELDFDSGAAILVVWGADGDPLLTDHAEASFFEGQLPASQDYYILVKAHPELGADFTLTVTIPPLDG